MQLRSATRDDSDTIWAMLEPVFRAGRTYAVDPGISRDDALAYWFAGRTYLALDDAGAALGTFYIQNNRPGGGAHYCNCGFVTSSAAQGRGVAQAMLDHALTEARAAGYEGMVFNFVVSANARAVALWSRNGFETVGRVPGAFRDPDGEAADALVMFRKL